MLTVRKCPTRSLAVIGATVVAVWGALAHPSVGAAPPAPGILETSRASYASVFARVQNVCFEYIEYPRAGPISVEEALEYSRTLLGGSWTGEFVEEWTAAKWTEAVGDARRRWRDHRPLESCEMVRTVRRYGDAYLDIDSDLLSHYAVRRPTADAVYVSPSLEMNWMPMLGRAIVQPGSGDLDAPYSRGNAGYIVGSVLFSGSHSLDQFNVSETEETPTTAVIRLHSRVAPGEEQSFRVQRGVKWLPTEYRQLSGGRVNRISRYEWTLAKGFGVFPVAVATIRFKEDGAYLWLTAVRRPAYSRDTALPLEVPPDTILGDMRQVPANIHGIRHAGLRGDWIELIRAGRSLEIPRFSISKDQHPSTNRRVSIPLGR